MTCPKKASNYIMRSIYRKLTDEKAASVFAIKLQRWINRIVHYAATWFVFPLSMYGCLLLSAAWLRGLSPRPLPDTLITSALLVFFAFIGYACYVPNGYRRYFNIVFVAPTVLGVILCIACIVATLIHGVPKHP